MEKDPLSPKGLKIQKVRVVGGVGQHLPLLWWPHRSPVWTSTTPSTIAGTAGGITKIVNTMRETVRLHVVKMRPKGYTEKISAKILKTKEKVRGRDKIKAREVETVREQI